MSNDYRKRFIATLLRLLPLAGLMIMLAFFFWLQPESSTQAAAPQAALLELTKSAPAEVPSGQEFTYSLLYKCASITEDCLDVTVTDVLPAELSGDSSHVTLVGSPHTTGTSYDEGSRTATWTFLNPLPAGSTGQVTLKVRFPAGTTPNGTSTTNEALINASNAPPVTSNPVSVTATAGSKWFAEKSLLVEMDPALDEEVNYRVRFCQPDDGDIGGLNINNAQLSDTFPAGATFVSASDGGVHDGASTVTWDLGNLEVDDSDYCVNRYLTVIYPSTTFSIDNIVTNECKGSGTLVGESSPLDPIGPVGVDHGFAEPTTDILFNKSGGSDRYAGQSFSFYFDVENEGNTRVDSFVISDTIDPAFNVYRIRSGYYSVPLSLTIRYQTNTNPTWVDLLGSPFDSLDNDDVNVSDLGLGDAYITAVQWDFGDAPPGFRDYTQPRIYATLINPDNEGNAVNVGDEKSNCAKLTWDENGTPVELENCEIVTVIEDPNGGANANNPRVDADKATVSSGPYLPNNTVSYRLMVRNRSSDNLYVNPIAMDLLPDGLEYVDGSWSLDPRDTGAPNPIFEKVDNYNDTGQTLLRWSWTGASAFGLDEDYIYIYFDVTVKPGTLAGSVSNSYQMTTNDGPMACYSSSEAGTDELDLDGDSDITDVVCQRSRSITVESVPAMESVKLVKGELDDQWHKYPDSGSTVPGGKDDYRLQVSNIGNVPMTNLVIVDILPFVGDTGVIDPQDRLSEWRPNLIGAVNAPAGVTVFYSTEQNPCRAELVPAGPAGCSPANWSTVPPADITTVQSLKFDFGSIVLDPLDSLELEWPMRAPIGAPDQGEIAWNSFGYVADRVDTGTSLLPAEPIKVGIAIQPVEPAAYGDYVWLDDNEDGVQNEAPERGLNGVQVNFYTDNGDNVPDPANDTLYSFTITTDDANGDPGYYQFTNLPVGCYFAEFERPAIYAITSLDQGADDTLDSDADPATGLTEVTCLEADEFDKSWDMGLVPATTASVGNYVWFDRNNDGTQNESTADGINGVTVKLYAEGGTTPILTTVTASDNSGNPGFYLFDNVDPGNYFICFDLPTDATFSGADAGGDDALDSDVTDTTNGCTDVFTLNVGDYDTTLDAGMILPTGSLSLGDTVWLDSDNDGQYDPFDGEVGINGVRVNLYRDSDDSGDYTPGTDEFVSTITTFTKAGDPGYYEFIELTADDYIVQVDPSNFTSTGVLNNLLTSSGNEPTPDPDDDADNDDNGDAMADQGVVSQAITLEEGTEPETDHNPTVDFGFMEPLDMDFGDAPDTYATLNGSNGARHVISDTIYLGAGVDVDEDGQPRVDADGDDTDAEGDDEDGVTLPATFIVDSTVEITVEAGAACTLSAWIDFDGNGSFAEPADDLFPGGTPLTAGSNTLNINVPADAVGGDTYARFRCTTAGAVSYDGQAPDGEVEDYKVSIIATQFDFGDAPDTYSTTLSSGGASHIISGTIYLGAGVDADDDGQPTADADGDDSDAEGDDEDGVTLPATLTAGETVDIEVVAGPTACALYAWMDFDGDGTFAQADNQIFSGTALTAGISNTLNISVPADAVVGDSYARFRCTTADTLSYDGQAPDGEVEDYKISIVAPATQFDFGDAPDSYSTLDASNGASHIISGTIYLGDGVDADDDGQPTPDADGDDSDAEGDDEDGVTLPATLTAGETVDIEVVAGPTACMLYAWMDFDGDGTFAQADNEIFSGTALTAGISNTLNISVPADAVVGDSYARFRCTTADTLSYDGQAPDGEVEDYKISIVAPATQFDFGDAPDSYSTLDASNGASHIISGTIYLGAGVDADDDGQPTPDADGDDSDAEGDDEDGVTLPATLTAGETVDIEVVAGPTACALYAWMDFDGDGTFAQADNQIFSGTALTAGMSNTLNISVPADAVVGDSYARFRCTTADTLSYDGQAPDGEVEDYKISIVAPAIEFDFGDAPDSYSTLDASNGANHVISGTIYLGAGVDGDDDGQDSPDADGDDTDADGDDEDGVSMPTAVMANTTVQVQVDANTACMLSAWMDFDGDGSFAEAGDQLFSALPLSAGNNPLSFAVPATAQTGDTYARFRCTTAGAVSYDGQAPDGEVEDYKVSIVAQPVDYGDAPDSYNTLDANNGASHVISGTVYLGDYVDADGDGQPTPDADGDDNDTTPDDEDGVTMPLTMTASSTVDIEIEANAACMLSAWMDFDGDGTFSQAGDELFSGTPLSAGNNSLSIAVPMTAQAGDTYARFRCTTDGPLSYNGPAGDGEVEDYKVSIVPPVDFGDAPDTYSTLDASNGPSHIMDGTTYLGAGVDADDDALPTPNADGDDTDADGDDEDGVTFQTSLITGETAEIKVVASAACVLSAWIDFDGDGSFAEAGDEIFPGGSALTAGPNTLNVTVPAGAKLGDTYARFRCTTDGPVSYDGQASDGEVEDYKVQIFEPAPQFDFGDAPEPTYPTLSASNGASHELDGTTYLGSGVDADTDGQPTPDADGDDTSGNDDEDGVTMPTSITPGTTVQVDVEASVACTLSAWVDFDGDGWDADDQISADVLTAGSNSVSFTVPTTATTGIDSYARFRCTTDGPVSYDGVASDGEVEDYKVSIVQPVDFGDAPDTYSTLDDSNGPSHIISGPYLGAGVDADDDGQPTSGNADGDDNDAEGDDEDGVTFVDPLKRGKNVEIEVVTSGNCTLSAWMDFDADGTFAQADNNLFPDGAELLIGTNSLNVTVPATAQEGDTYARFRCSTTGVLPYDGPATNGEVEDYLVQIVAPDLDYGDAPSDYSTLQADSGPNHIIDGLTYLGSAPDAENDGQPTPNADGDDNDSTPNDEDGVTFLDQLEPDTTVEISVNASKACVLSAWIDFEGNNSFADADNDLFPGGTLLSAGPNVMTVTVPSGATVGDTYARFRCTTDGPVSYEGQASNGEVEDYKVSIVPPPVVYDFGDAPDSYDTTLANNGPRHIITGPFLGTDPLTDVDADDDGQPTTADDALGDDNDTDGDDENGVTFLNPLQPGVVANIELVASDVCTLSAWMDFDGDGTFTQADDALVFVEGSALAAGTNSKSFTVPAGAQVGSTFARFRCTTDGPVSYNGPANDGEVEDYKVSIIEPDSELDFGDAPDTYNTTVANGGASHVISGTTYLGNAVDAENDGQPNANADGDDSDANGDDEDGVTFVDPFKPGTMVNITVEAKEACVLSAWMDFDGDGTFTQADNDLFPGGTALIAGSNAKSIAVPANAQVGDTYTRFRCTTSGPVSYNGAANDGEVEDYKVTIVAPDLDFGDAPSDYPTLDADNGPSHIIDGDTYLGSGVDVDNDGQPTTNADGDDLDAEGDDDDGVTFQTLLIPGEEAEIEVVAHAACVLSAWIDFDGNNSFAEADDNLFPSGMPLAAGSNTLNFTVPASAQSGDSYARFRCTTAGAVSYDGPAPDGEVEDYKVTIPTFDFGDVPDPDYPTLLANDGARHVIDGTTYLGSGVDADDDGQPTVNADGDDSDTTPNDEDGVTFVTPLIPGDTAQIEVVASTACTLSAWMDFDDNGSFVGDDIFPGGTALSAGSQTLTFNVPANAESGDTYARFRCTTEGAVSYDGAAPDGEVEDYKITIASLDFGDAPDPTYPTLLASDGPRHVVDNVTYLGSSVDSENDGQPTANADGDGSDDDGVTFLTDLTPGSNADIEVVASAACTLSAWIDFDGDGLFSAADDIFPGGTALSAGSNSLNISVPANASMGIDTYARFRCTTDGPVSYDGTASDGEVEDYKVEIPATGMDFGDAPDATYPTLLANDGPRHIIDGVIYLGSGVDADDDGQPTANADGDDSDANGDDEDGVTFLGAINPGDSAEIEVLASTACTLSAWIDFNGDGSFAEAGDDIFPGGQILSPGVNALTFNVPASAGTNIDTYARFRCTSSGPVSYTGLAPDGEVEDYLIALPGSDPEFDYGDAPDNYATILNNNGPHHLIDGVTYLGGQVDKDEDGQPTPNADGDDSDTTGDDEDGVTFVSPLIPGDTAQIEVVASSACTLSAWMDFDGDGSFMGDDLFPGGTALTAGSNSFSVSVPADAQIGDTYARFRCTTAGPVSYDGAAPDGEVEDYLVSVAALDYGDAPDTYATLADSTGPTHILSDIFLGSAIDTDDDGQPTPDADGDDLDTEGNDDDGVTFLTPLGLGGPAKIDVVASSSCVLSAWIDFDGNGTFDASDELFPGGYTLFTGNNVIEFPVPADAQIGDTYARFRCATEGALPPTGPAADGEVEDYKVELTQPVDFGDAPDGTYPTLLADNGASHLIDGVTYLGTDVDGEEGDGQPSADALGDDIDANDDEDGVTFTTALVPGEDAQLEVVANSACVLSAWIDWKADGWDAGDEIFPGGYSLIPGTNFLSIDVPVDATLGLDTYARFRCTTTGPLSYDGPATDGEVEDYLVSLSDVCSASIGDYVWLDSNGDGNQDPNEIGLPGIVVNLIGAGIDGQLGTADDVTYPSQSTDADGQYNFSDLQPGLYQVNVDESTLPSGFGLTTGNQPMLVTLNDCGVYDQADFGYVPSVCERSVMYGVHDSGTFDTQFFKLDLGTGTTSPLGPQYDSHDVESIEIHPLTGQLYAIAGNNGGKNGMLYKLDKETGALTEIGNAGVSDLFDDEIVSAAFDSNGTLWAFEQNVGLVSVDLTNGDSTLAWDIRETSILDRNWEGIAWAPEGHAEGDYLYGADGTKMYRWDPNTNSAEQVCGNDFLPDATEALDFRFDGKLLGGWHNATDNSLSIFEINIASCTIEATEFAMPYNDVESLASEECVAGGAVQGQVTDNQNNPREMRRGPIANAQVKLEADTNGDGQASYTAYTTTNRDGFYNFLNLPFGNYKVSVAGNSNVVDFDLTNGDAREEVPLNLSDTTTAPPTNSDNMLFLPLIVR